MKFSLNHIITGSLLTIVLILSFILIFRKPEEKLVVEPFDDTKLREQIELEKQNALFWEQKALLWQNIATKAIQKSDSLENLKPNIKNHYEKTYNHIDTADVHELDSIIRSNW